MSSPTAAATSPPGKNKRRPKWREAVGCVAVRFWFGRYAYLSVTGYVFMLLFFWIALANLTSGSAASVWSPPGFTHLFGVNAGGQDVLHASISAGAKPLSAAILASFLGVGLSVLAGWGVSLSAKNHFGFVWLARSTRYLGFLSALVVVLIFSAAWGGGFWKLVLLFTFVSCAATLAQIGEWFEELEERGDTVMATVLGLTRSENIRGNYIAFVAKRGVALACGLIPGLVLGETALSFVGFGIGADSWGGLLAAGHDVIFEAPWLMIYPGLVATFSLISLAFLGWLARKSMDGEIPPRIF